VSPDAGWTRHIRFADSDGKADFAREFCWVNDEVRFEETAGRSLFGTILMTKKRH
jgi:hypothetical protein